MSFLKLVITANSKDPFFNYFPDQKILHLYLFVWFVKLVIILTFVIVKRLPVLTKDYSLSARSLSNYCFRIIFSFFTFSAYKNIEITLNSRL